MHYDVTREAIDAMMSAPGEVIGSVLKIDEKYILKRGGAARLKMIEEEFGDMGHPFEYKRVNSKEYYPWGRRALSLLAISRVFNMNKEEVIKMGKSALQMFFLKKLFIVQFSTIEKLLKREEELWRKNHTIGRLEIVDVNREKRMAVLRLYNLNFHPIFCDYLCGYFAALARLVEGDTAYCREENCFFKGESFFHEFLLTW